MSRAFSRWLGARSSFGAVTPLNTEPAQHDHPLQASLDAGHQALESMMMRTERTVASAQKSFAEIAASRLR